MRDIASGLIKEEKIQEDRLAVTSLILVSVLCTAGISLIGTARGQQVRGNVPVSERSYREARRVLEAAIASYGGRDALRTIENFSVRFDGESVHRNQSRRPDPPYDRTPLSGLLVVDLKNGRVSHEISRTNPGGFDGHTRLVTDGKQGVLLDLLEKKMSTLGNPSFSNQRERLRWLPHNILLDAGNRSVALRSLGTAVFNKRPHDLITYATEDGQQLTLYLDSQTRLISKFETIFSDVIVGETASETIFPEYQIIEGKFKIPTRRILRRAGETTEEIAYAEVILSKALSDATFQIPTGFELEKPAPTNQPSVTKLGEDVYAVRAATGYNVMFAAMNGYIVVFEAPINDSTSNGVIAKIKETVPNKPIKYVVLTHHHNDHSGGVRAYVREGASIITTPGNRRFFSRMVADVFLPSPSGRAPIARREFIETIQDKRRTFSDGKRIEIYDIGPSPHAKEMTVAYLPNERILFQGDLLNLPDESGFEGANMTTRHFADWLEKSNLAVDKIIGVHGRMATPEDLRRALKAVR